MAGNDRHDVDDDLTTKGASVLRCLCGWQSHPLPHESDDTWQEARELAEREHVAHLVEPDPGQLLLLGDDGDGPRFYLAGKPMYAGSPVELLTPAGWWPGRFETGPGEGRAGPVPRFHGLLGGPAWDKDACSRGRLRSARPGGAPTLFKRRSALRASPRSAIRDQPFARSVRKTRTRTLSRTRRSGRNTTRRC